MANFALCALAKALREPMPFLFTWDYRRCETCAIGLGERLGIFPSVFPSMRAAYLGITNEEHAEIFYGALVYGRETAPDDVADVIDTIIAKKEGMP